MKIDMSFWPGRTAPAPSATRAARDQALPDTAPQQSGSTRELTDSDSSRTRKRGGTKQRACGHNRVCVGSGLCCQTGWSVVVVCGYPVRLKCRKRWAGRYEVRPGLSEVELWEQRGGRAVNGRWADTMCTREDEAAAEAGFLSSRAPPGRRCAPASTGHVLRPADPSRCPIAPCSLCMAITKVSPGPPSHHRPGHCNSVVGAATPASRVL